MNWHEFEQVFSGAELEGNKIILKSDIHEALKFIVGNYTYKTLKEIIAVDKKELGTELIYHLYSNADEESVMVSTMVKDEAESVVDIFKSAQADENEIFDLFGVKFIGNENLKRMYMPEDWKGSPLKKDYVESDTRLAWNDNNDV